VKRRGVSVYGIQQVERMKKGANEKGNEGKGLKE
jgi:hypothetical protein